MRRYAYLGAALALFAGAELAQARAACEAGKTFEVAGRIAELSSNLLNVYAAMRVLEPSCAFDRLEMSFQQAEGCEEGDLLIGTGDAALSDVGRRAIGGEARPIIRMTELQCAPPR